MNLKKFLAISILSASIISSSITSFTPITAYANESIETSKYTYLEPVKESDYVVDKSERNIFTKIAKSAIKKAIKNRTRVVSLVEKVSGKTVAKNVDKFFNPIASALTPLLEWAEIPGQAVYDAVFRAVVNAGGSRSVATNIALAIREVLEWTIL